MEIEIQNPTKAINLTFDKFIQDIKEEFGKVNDIRKNPQYSLQDTLLGGFAMFSLKDPSLLAFEERIVTDKNLKIVYKLGKVPSDSQMRIILDEVNPEELRKSFKVVLDTVMEANILENYKFINDSVLLSGDGTGTFSSPNVHGECCMKKKGKNPLYYHMMYSGSFVHPDRKEVIPVMPEMIYKHDGDTKNDCELNAMKRFIKDFRNDYPNLNVTFIADGLSSKAPHINLLHEHNLHYVLIAKEGDHKYLFEQFEEKQREGKTTQLTVNDSKNKRILYFSFCNDLPLNKENQDVRVNFIECKQVDKKGKITTFTWVTDHLITVENVAAIARAGRARWKIENETFNTLKNQGYHLEHNYGHGNKHLSSVFSILTVLAFLVDQIQEICYNLFQAALGKFHARKYFWEKVRGLFDIFEFESMKQLYEAIAYGFQTKIQIQYSGDTS